MRKFIIIIAALLAFACSAPKAPVHKDPIRSIDDVKGQTVSVVVGSSHDIYLSKNHTEVPLIRTESVQDQVMAIYGGQAVAGAFDGSLKNAVLSENQDMIDVEHPMWYDSLSMCFMDPLLLKKFNLLIEDMKFSGELDSLRQVWDNFDGIARMKEFEHTTENGVLKASLGNFLPFATIQDGKAIGYDIEILNRFCARYHMELEVQFSNFPAQLPALKTGKVDVVGGGITPTPERKQAVLFSHCYYTCPVILITKKEYAGMKSDDNENKTSFIESLKHSIHINLIKENRYKLIIDGLVVTLKVSIWSILLGTLLGGLICYLRMSRKKLFRTAAAIYINILRGIPQLVLLLIMFYVVFANSSASGLFVAILTFGINLAAYVSEMFRTAIESVDKGQKEAGIALGFSNVKTFIHIIAPQAIKRVFPVYKGEIISLVKMTSIVGYIAVQDLTKAGDIIRSRTFDAFFPLVFVALIYFVISWGLTWLLSLIDKKAA